LARDYYQDFVRQSGDDPDLREPLALAYFRVGTVSRETGKLDQAREAFQQARDRYQALEHAHPDKPSYKTDLAKTYRHLGIAQAFDGRPDEATTSFQQAIDLGEALVDKHPNDSQVSEYRKDLAWAYNNFANQQGGLHKPTQALKYYKKAVSIWGKGD